MMLDISSTSPIVIEDHDGKFAIWTQRLFGDPEVAVQVIIAGQADLRREGDGVVRGVFITLH